MDETTRKSMPLEKLRYPKSPKPLPRTTKSLVDISIEKTNSSDEETREISVKWVEGNDEDQADGNRSVYENLPATTETFLLPDVIKHKPPHSVTIVDIPPRENMLGNSNDHSTSQEKSEYRRKLYEIPSYLELQNKVRNHSTSSDDSMDEVVSPPVTSSDMKESTLVVDPSYPALTRHQNWSVSNEPIYGNIPQSTKMDEINSRTPQYFVSSANLPITPPQIIQERTDTSSSDSSSENEPRYSNLPLKLTRENNVNELFTNNTAQQEIETDDSSLSSADSEHNNVISPTKLRESYAKELTFDDITYDSIVPLPTFQENVIKISSVLPNVSIHKTEFEAPDLEENDTSVLYNVVYDQLPPARKVEKTIRKLSLPNFDSISTMQDNQPEKTLVYDVVSDTSFPKLKDNIFMKSPSSKTSPKRYLSLQPKLENITAKETYIYDEVYRDSYPLPKFEDGSLKISSAFPSVSFNKGEIQSLKSEQITDNYDLLYDEVYDRNFPATNTTEKNESQKLTLNENGDTTKKLEQIDDNNLPLPPNIEAINKNLERISNLKINFPTIEETKDISTSTVSISETIEIITPIIEATKYDSDSSDSEDFYFKNETLGETIIFRYDSMPDETINKIHEENIKSSTEIQPTDTSDSDEEMVEEVIYDVTLPREPEPEDKAPHTYDDVSPYDPDDPPPPPLPKRGILIPKEEIIRRRPSNVYNILPVSSDLGLRKKTAAMKKMKLKRSDSSSSDSSVELDVTVRKQLNRFSGFLQTIRTNTESKFKKSKSSDDVETIGETHVLARPAGDVNCSIQHFGILSEKRGDQRIKWKVSLENGVLKWVSEHGEDSMLVMDIISITAVNNAGSEWSHGVSLCHVVGSAAEARVRSFSCRSRPERDTWLCALLGAATAALPATHNLTRAGWLHVKEEAGAAWQPGWMLLADQHVAYCLEGGELRELDLRNDATVVSQVHGGSSVVVIELLDVSLLLRSKIERDTVQWEKYLFSASTNVPQPPELPYGVSESVAAVQVNKLPRSLGVVGKMHVAVHVGLFSSAVVVQVTLSPHTTAGEVCTELGRGEDHMLQEFVLGGALARPLHPSERVLEVVMRWGDWDMEDQQNNQLVFASCQFYLDSKAMARQLMTASGKLRVGLTERRGWRWSWLEMSQKKIRLYKKETSSRKRKEWRVNDIVWYLGHERSRNPHTKWSITFIKKENKPSRSRLSPHFGVTLGGYGREELLQWSAALLLAAFPGGL